MTFEAMWRDLEPTKDGYDFSEIDKELAMAQAVGKKLFIMVGTKGKMMCGTYGIDPQLLPTSRTKDINVPQTIRRIPGGSETGHYTEWVEACLQGYGKMELSSDFSFAGPLTESILMGNLAIRSYDIRKVRPLREGSYDYPGRNIKLRSEEHTSELQSH